MVFAAQTVRVVPRTAKKPVDQWESTGANHHPPAAVKITVALKRGLVKDIKSEIVDMRNYISKRFGGHLWMSELNSYTSSMIKVCTRIRENQCSTTLYKSGVL